MEKKTLTTKEIFCGIPKLKDHFTEIDRTIEAFQPQEGKSEGIERLKKKRRKLLKTVTQMDRTDLRILYYIRNLEKICSFDVARRLEKLFLAQEELKNFLSGNEEPAKE